ncbi:ATP-binding protein [Limisalsivibrio acetivorans]|uniref:ATP-binding protein n=1 Tax=Limisalsivibrio acetivorans TaxID=1304888 RepID=UPI0003B462F2|nr:ATP-binding protein [Limisalsivibrio acetivorans]
MKLFILLLGILSATAIGGVFLTLPGSYSMGGYLIPYVGAILFISLAAWFSVFLIVKRKSEKVDYYRKLVTEELKTGLRLHIHEFRNDIQNLLLKADLIERGKESGGDIKDIRFLLNEATGRLNGYSANIKGGEKGRIRLSRITSAAVGRAERIAEKGSIKVVKHSSNMAVKYPPEMLGFALTILMANAAEYSGGEPVEVEITDRKLGTAEYIDIRITERGVPYDDGVEDVFSPYYNDIPGLRDRIGLATVRRIATDLGGYVEMDKTGDATEFLISIPVVK